MFRMVRARVPRIDADGIVLSAHCHDDLGLAVANTIAAIEAGVRQDVYKRQVEYFWEFCAKL